MARPMIREEPLPTDRRRRLLGGLCLLVAAATPVRAQEAAALAPADRWYTDGGCAARTGRSASPPARRGVEVAWTHRTSGEIEGEPRTWDRRIALALREGPGRRRLLVLETVRGQLRAHVELRASLPLTPAMWEDTIAIRPELDRVDVLHDTGVRLVPLRTIRTRSTLSEPLLFEDSLYLREGDELVRYDLDRNEPVWRTRAAGAFRGRPSLRDGHLYAVFYDRRGQARLARVDAATGEVVEDVLAGHHRGTIPPGDAPLSVAVLEREAFVRFPLPIHGAGGAEYDQAAVPLRDGRLYRGRGASIHSGATDPLAWGEGWVALEDHGRSRRWVASKSEGQRAIQSLVLAAPESHAELLEPPTAAAGAGDVLYLHGLGVAADDFEVLWRGPRVPLVRPVPISGGVLVVDQPGRLVCLREPPRPLARAEVAAREVERSMEARLAESYARLALESLRAGDPALTGRLIEEAELRGAGGRTLGSARTGLERVEAAEAKRGDRRLARLIEERERALLLEPLERMCDEARDTRDHALRLALLGGVLERAPEHPEALALVRDLLPPDAPRGPIDALSWLEFLRARERAPVRFVEIPADPLVRNADERMLADEARLWRPDLVGYRSDRLFVVTPPGRPGAVARALSLGELVCDALEEVFQPLGARDGTGDPEPLTLLLYETRQEYIAQSQRERSLPEIARGWTAGHYSPEENLSRIYMPEEGDAARRLLDVYAHELAHHWLAARGPFPGRTAATVERPGYWIAEGFASLVEEFALDPEAGLWDPIDPRAESLDALANTRPEELVPWKHLFSASKEDFLALSTTPDRPVQLSWRLGVHAERSEVQLFYAQAAAVCHYLFNAEGGRHRPALLQYVRAWYAGPTRALAVREAFGLELEDLGARATAYAREAVGGGR